jgi:hypothetical protein
MDEFGEIASCASFSVVAMGLRECDSILWKDSKAFSIRTGVEGTAPQLRIVFKIGAVTVSAKSEFNSAARRVRQKLSKTGARNRCIVMAVIFHEGSEELSGAGKRNVKEL